MPTKKQEYRLVLALVPLESVAAVEKGLPEQSAFVTVKWSDNPVRNQKAVTEGIVAMNDTYCPKPVYEGKPWQ